MKNDILGDVEVYEHSLRVLHVDFRMIIKASSCGKVTCSISAYEKDMITLIFSLGCFPTRAIPDILEAYTSRAPPVSPPKAKPPLMILSVVKWDDACGRRACLSRALLRPLFWLLLRPFFYMDLFFVFLCFFLLSLAISKSM